MSAYVLAQLSFTDEALYRRYQHDFPSVFAESGGEVLVADEAPDLLEGDWYGDKVVILKFPNKRDAIKFMNSALYRDISTNRRAGANTVSLLLEGV